MLHERGHTIKSAPGMRRGKSDFLVETSVQFLD